jgi:hypothetical protein
MKKILALAAVAFFGLSGAAHAAFENISIGSTDGSYVFVANSNTITPDVNLNTALTSGSLTLNAFSQLLPAGTSINNYATSPAGATGSYLAVHGFFGFVTGVATFTLAPDQHSFGFTWGSIDTFNTLTITDSRGYTFTITGTDLLNAIGGTASSSQSVVDITDGYGTITKAVFSSTGHNAFEAANFYEGTVPLPAALPMFGAALLGLAFFARRARQAKI